MREDKIPQICVVVPVFNKAAHLDRCFGSIFKQTLQPARIIAVDDASTDNSVEILRRLARPNVTIIERPAPNQGPGFARNTGIRAADGEWIAFLDADDEWKPDFLETVARQIAQADEDVSCIFTGFENSYGDRKTPHEFVRRYGYRGPDRLDLEDFIMAWLRTKRCPAHTSSIVIRKRVLEAVGMFPEGPTAQRGEDIALWLKCVAHGDALVDPTICAVYHRDAENMVTGRVSANRAPAICEVIRRLLPQRSQGERRLLKRLNNHIIFDYARIAVRSEPLDLRMMQQLYITPDVGRTMALMAVAATRAAYFRPEGWHGA
ncbi:fucosyltransferase [Agaricicola taiwanensis]|uniref:Fucosyltransferase n=1 Tax=Agaricicola taiwanensis TaxID=591372 RepID=A0A8J2YKN1_9RHOB|nr:glycosyltransferase family A protein [Agaricicola taiwanensis]GGE48961.1 fucosyltransferase [Agaricicola taiwanensis]